MPCLATPGAAEQRCGGVDQDCAGDDILDMVFDWNDDLYIETNAGEIERVDSAWRGSVAHTVTGQGRLAITPDGGLVRIIPAPTGTASFEEWELPDC